MTQTQLAEELGSSPASVSNWERAFVRKGKPGLPRRENILAAIRFFRPQLTPTAAQSWADPAGHPRTAADLPALFSGNTPALPRQFIPLPPLHINRPGLQQTALTQLKETRALALVGLGGNGKTTLAAWLARRLEALCPDGSVWSSEGTVGDRQAMLARSFGVTLFGASLAERAGELRTLLADKICLLVLDDVGDSPELAHLAVVNPRSYLLITTRDQKVADQLALPALAVGGLTEAEGEALLTAWVGRPIAATALVRRWAGSPLALNLNGAKLRWRVCTLEELLQTTDLGLLDLDEPQHRHHSLVHCFDDTCAHLSPPNHPRLLQLGVFNGQFNLAAVAGVWGIGEAEARSSLLHLQRWHLLEREKTEHYRLHPLLREYTRQKLTTNPDLSFPAYRRHAVYLIRHYLYHPGVLDDDQATAPSLDEVWPEVVAGVRWAAQHEPRLAAIAVVLAHTERAALLAALGEPLLAAVKAYAANVTEASERAVLAEMLADLALSQSGFEAAVALFEEAGLLWQEQGNRLSASYVSLRQAGVQLLRADPTAALIAVQQALHFLTLADLPTAATIETWRWVYYWFDALLSLLVRRSDCTLAIPVTLRQIAQKSGYDILIGRGWHLERLWWSAPGLARLETDRQRQDAAALSVESWRAWRRGGEREKADREVTWSRYELHGQFNRRTARRYGRRLSRLTPTLTAAQQQLLADPALRWWVKATEAQRLAWFGQMYPRYLGVAGQRPLFPRGRVWVKSIEAGSAWGVQARRWGAMNLPARCELEQAERFLFSGIKPMPLLDTSHQQVAVNYLAELSQ